MKIRNSLAILCSAIFVLPLCLAGCKGQTRKSYQSGEVPEGYYQVSFETKGGTAIEPQVIKAGEKATKPATDPTNDGQKFTGWYEEFEAVTPFNFDLPIQSTTTVYAGWTIDRDSFYDGGGTSEGGGGGGDPANTIYIDLGSCTSFWGEKFQYTGTGGGLFAYFFDGSSGPVTWPGTLTTQVIEHSVYRVNVPSGMTKVIFNMNSTAGTWTGDTQTEDIVLPTDGKNLFTINTNNSGSKQNGVWSTYAG